MEKRLGRHYYPFPVGATRTARREQREGIYLFKREQREGIHLFKRTARLVTSTML